jgi:hypothetical protein
MEPVTIAFLFIIAIASGEQDKKHQAQIAELEAQYEMLDSQFLKLTGAHSAFYAGQQLVNEDTNTAIEDLYQKIEEEQY